jgi:hypothetical protein
MLSLGQVYKLQFKDKLIKILLASSFFLFIGHYSLANSRAKDVVLEDNRIQALTILITTLVILFGDAYGKHFLIKQDAEIKDEFTD